ncbi:unnamed protein product [Symbiodinium natans]|uniref:Uncharacterized protein n=1 Tax=Symbiodinium natans TaxID=878477 RepID=A0A812IB49_9DINO|nr:unnamed protein product [Symbiodinium natans]
MVAVRRETFADTLALLRAHDMTHVAPHLARMKIVTPTQLREAPWATILEVARNGPDLEKLCLITGRPAPGPHSLPRARQDFPIIAPSARGSLAAAKAAASPALRQQALSTLHQLEYAATTQRTRSSRWKSWCTLAEAWDLPPIPITTNLVDAIGASLRFGGYKSAKQLFSQAAQEHVARSGEALPEAVRLRMKQVERAVERGRGPAAAKDSFVLEDFERVDLERPFPEASAWLDSVQAAVDVIVICCWWMFRGIEAAAARLQHAWTEQTVHGRLAFITLPCHKTDTVGMCVTRSHVCSCHRSARLCPYHALHRHLVRVRRWTPDPDAFLFPGREGAMSHTEIIDLFRAAIRLTGCQMTRPGPRADLLQKFNEHACRVSGAQFLTRFMRFPLETVQLIGRWGSDAVKLYVQETPLCHVNELFDGYPIQRPAQVRELVEHYLETLRTKFWVVNTTTKCIHIPGVPEVATENIHWHTICGWPYGLAPHRKEYKLPLGQRCKRCFRADELRAAADAASDDELLPVADA